MQDKIPTDKIPADKIPADKIPTDKIPTNFRWTVGLDFICVCIHIWIKINIECMWPLKTIHNALGERMYFQDGSGLKGSVTMSCIVEYK